MLKVVFQYTNGDMIFLKNLLILKCPQLLLAINIGINHIVSSKASYNLEINFFTVSFEPTSHKKLIASPKLRIQLISNNLIFNNWFDIIITKMNLERTVKWIDKTQGRDKFCKSIQYACRFLKDRFQKNGNKESAQKFDALFSNMRDARKLFRLFKTLNQYKKMKELIDKGDLSADTILNLLIRLFFGLYWVFDNLAILSKIKVINRDPKPYGKNGAACWFIALTFNLILILKNIYETVKKAQKLQKSYYSSPNEKEIQQKRKEYLNTKNKLWSLGINVIKVVGDMIPAGQASQLYPNMFNISASDSACGLGGLASALISSYQLYD